MIRRSSLGWPITLGVVMIVLLVALTVGWIVVTVTAALSTETPAPYWIGFAVGTVCLILAIVGVVLYLLISIKEIRLNQRQSNFIDSVTHELKSPIASLKLSLQTLERRKLGEQQQADFHRFMAQDLERLDSLIDHLLDAARIDKPVAEDDLEEVDVAEILKNCVDAAKDRYRLPDTTFELKVESAIVRARPIDLDILFRNLIDNAVKYGGKDPLVEIESVCDTKGRVVTKVSDNGPGIPPMQRRMIFRRFFRIGSELERSKVGTGLGLYIVRTLVKQLRGSVQVHGRGTHAGTMFEVMLPLAVKPSLP